MLVYFLRYVFFTTVNTSVQSFVKQQPFVLMLYRRAQGAAAITAAHESEQDICMEMCPSRWILKILNHIWESLWKK